MIGIIVTGHGNFATGIESALTLLVGKQENFAAIDFTADVTMDTLTEKIELAVKSLADCQAVCILCDLAGGTPFNRSSELKMKMEQNIEVIGGVNLPIVMEAIMERETADNPQKFTQELLETGRSMIICYVMADSGEDESDE